jgi:hypothetical protein
VIGHGLPIYVALEPVDMRFGYEVLGVETPKTLFRRGILHSSVVAHVMAQKFSLGVPHYRLEQHLAGQGVELDRGLMCRYVEEAGSTCGATVVHAMWQDALASSSVLSTDAPSALIQPEKSPNGQRQAYKKGHFFTVVADSDHCEVAPSTLRTTRSANFRLPSARRCVTCTCDLSC